MRLQELAKKNILILGFGAEGQATYEYLRRHFPDKTLTVADQRKTDEFPQDLIHRLQRDTALIPRFGPAYLNAVEGCEIIIKTPGIPATLAAIGSARKTGCTLTSHSQIFLTNYARERVIGITGTKGRVRRPL